MSTNVDSLRDLYVEVAGEKSITERQEEDTSREPIDEDADPGDEVTAYAREDGLSDALEGADAEA